MSVTGIIAEYNPFHSGHEYLLNKARLMAQNDPIVVVMSGNYVQRGDIAILSKWTRAQAALDSGADLIFELPFQYAVQPANIFAEGAMNLLSSLGVTDLYFGAEDENLNYNYLGEKIAGITASRVDFNDYTQTYATQYNQLVAEEVGQEVTQPNIMLAIAYAVANTKLDHAMTLHPVQRIGADHDELNVGEQPVVSATALRNLMLTGVYPEQVKKWVPTVEVEAITKNLTFPSWSMLFPFLKYRLESSSVDELAPIYQMNEGLQYKMKQEIHTADDFTSFMRQIKSKRYTYARLRRTAIYALLNVTDSMIKQQSTKNYLHLLGYSNTGRKYLHNLRKQIEIPIISKVDKKNGNNGELALEVRVDRLYEQLTGEDQNYGRKPLEAK